MTTRPFKLPTLANSYTGGAYSYRHWAVAGVYRHSNCRQVARDLQSQLADILWESTS